VRVVSKRNLWLAALLIGVICWAHGAESGVIATAILAVIYLASLWLSPRQRHTGFRSCKGSGELHGVLFKHAHRKCPRCNSGRKIRAGAAIAGPAYIRQEAAAAKGARKLAKSEHRWR
jgi:hypothetical protein